MRSGIAERRRIIARRRDRIPMARRLVLAVLAAGGLVVPSLASAHHSTEALFDRSRTIEFVGVLNKVDIINPHSWFRFDEYRDGTFVREWSIEGGAPSQI